MAGHQLAMDPGDAVGQLAGIPTTEPAFGLPAVWIADGGARRGRGARLHRRRRRVGRSSPTSPRRSARTPPSCSRARRRRQLLDQLKEVNAAVVDEVVPDVLSLGEIQRVLQSLLREGVSIRDLGAIVEAIGDKARAHARPGDARRVRAPGARPHDRRPATSTTRARCARSRSTRRSSRRSPRRSSQTADGEFLAMDPSRAAGARRRAAPSRSSTRSRAAAARCCCARRACAATCAASCEQALPQLAVCSYNEIAPGVGVETIGVLGPATHGATASAVAAV